MNIVICEDKPIVRGQIRKHIMAGDEDINIREVSSADDLENDTDMDMLFLGIHFEDVNRIETARWLRKDGIEIPVVFVTSLKEEEPLIFNTKKKNYTLKQEQILYAENVAKKIVLHTAGENIAIYGTMKELENQLDDRFFRCHRGYLINLEHISGYQGDSIQVDNGDSIFLSRAKYSDFVRTYMEFLGKEADG